MKKILKEDNRSVITRDGDKVIKTFPTPRLAFSSEYNWLFHYESFYNKYGGVVQVYEANENRIVMDYIDGVPFEELQQMYLIKLDHSIAYKAFATILQNLSNMADYSSNLEKVWFHRDAGSYNHIYFDGEFVLIDPDSFTMVRDLDSCVYSMHAITRSIELFQSRMKTFK